MGEYFGASLCIRVATLIDLIVWIRVATLIDFNTFQVRVDTLIGFPFFLLRVATLMQFWFVFDQGCDPDGILAHFRSGLRPQ